jgi:hypothetical protein
VDDFLVGCDNPDRLKQARQTIMDHLAGIRLRLHRKKTVIFPNKRGLTFLGFRLYPGRILAGKRCGRRFIKRLRQLQMDYASGEVDVKDIKQVIAAYNGHLSHGHTAKLRNRILFEHPFTRSEIAVINYPVMQENV